MAGREFSEKRETISVRNADNLSRQITSTSTSESSNDVAKRGLMMDERLSAKMFSYEIICLLIVIIFTAMAALQSSPPRLSKPPLAKPFFDQNSPILDFYKGHLEAMIERIIQADFSFVMYYAPWDAESQALRHEFESVARFYYPQIFFAAINCWHPDSECRTQYNKIHGYPVLMLYPSRDSGIYYRGIRTAPYMIRFLDALVNPIVRITHKEQLMELLVDYDAVVVGYFNFTRLDTTPGYREFYKAAIRSLERDPNRDVVFAIVTSELCSKLHYGIYKFPSASLLMWNESLSYPEDREWTFDNILNWISNSVHQPSLWLQPPGIKALTLAPYLREGPVLFLFTPRNPLHTENYIYNLIREIGLQYYNCADSILVKDIIARLETKRRTAVIRHFSKNQECVDLQRNESYIEQIKDSAASISIQQWINNSCCANVAMNKCLLCKTNVINPLKKEMCVIISKKFNDVCKDTDIFTNPVTIRQHQKDVYNCNKNYISMKLEEELKLKRLHAGIEYKSSLLKNKNDSQSASVVRRNFFKDDCKKWTAGNDYHPSVFPRKSSRQFNISLKESVCKTNKTLALIAIDSLHYFQFAEHLGIDISKNKTTVIILDAALESQYVMHHEFSEYVLVDFINNYTQSLLQRTLRSNNAQHYKEWKLLDKDNNNTQQNGADLRPKIRVPELTTRNFLSTILDSTKDVVIMYHSPYCGFCNAISYVYLTVAYYLSNMNHLTFVRIDGDNNDLPWEYSMNRFPSILFFPAKRKEDSTVYPFSVPITIPNLLNFVLANLDGDSHVEALTNICQVGTGEAPDKCIARTRRLCLDIIEELLQDYRKLRRHLSFLNKKIVRNKRKIILLKLEHIKDIHLILGSTVDLSKDPKKTRLIKRKFFKYYNVIKSLETDEKIKKQSSESQSAVHATPTKRDNLRSEL